MDETWIHYYTLESKCRLLSEQQLVKAVQSDQKLKRQLASLDLGLRVFPKADADRHDIVQSSPTQQLNNNDEYYPEDDEHTLFQFSFLKKTK
ncbi:hypothetical protein TNCV_1182571 [Trichonephila clavipes]|nr:hypothetical protein TNCV_1182571 [Trichonephila clavipes]